MESLLLGGMKINNRKSLIGYKWLPNKFNTRLNHGCWKVPTCKTATPTQAKKDTELKI